MCITYIKGYLIFLKTLIFSILKAAYFYLSTVYTQSVDNFKYLYYHVIHIC